MSKLFQHASHQHPSVRVASCPTCGQPAGQPCLTLQSRQIAEPHRARVKSVRVYEREDGTLVRDGSSGVAHAG